MNLFEIVRRNILLYKRHTTHNFPSNPEDQNHYNSKFFSKAI